MGRDIYQGTGDPSLEARFKLLWNELSRVQAGVETKVTTVLNQTNVTTNGLDDYKAVVAAQFAAERAASNLAYVAAGTTFLTPNVISAAFNVPADYQMIVFKNLEVSAGADLDVEGELVIL